jgi:RNA recognition motif-containing protein
VTNSEIASMLQEIICDLKPEISQNEDVSEEQLQRLTDIVQKYLQKPDESPKTGEKRLFVGNLSYNVLDEDLLDWFESYGKVQSAWVVIDKETNRSKGFGFVEMETEAEALAAVKGLNGRNKDGRALTVNVARPKPPSDNKTSFKKSRRY